MAEVTEVQPSGSGLFMNTVTVTARELKRNQVHYNVPVLSGSPRGSETPRVGDRCLVEFENFSNENPYIRSWMPGGMKQQNLESSSYQGESRVIHESGAYSVETEDGSKIMVIKGSLDIQVK